MIYGRLDSATGRLTDISPREPSDPAALPPNVSEVPLDSMPVDADIPMGTPMGYDAANRKAIPLPTGKMHAHEKAALVGSLGADVLTALLLKASPTVWNSLSVLKQRAAQDLLDQTAQKYASVF